MKTVEFLLYKMLKIKHGFKKKELRLKNKTGMRVFFPDYFSVPVSIIPYELHAQTEFIYH